MTKSRFVYVTYIASTPQRVWQALLDPEFTRQYWDSENLSDWQPGSSWEHRRADAEHTLLMAGRVLESSPPHRLVFTWARPAEAADPAKHSRVTFELVPVDQMVRLTVTHEELEPASEMLESISQGWPRVLSGLKTLLETGRSLPKWNRAQPSGATPPVR